MNVEWANDWNSRASLCPAEQLLLEDREQSHHQKAEQHPHILAYQNAHQPLALLFVAHELVQLHSVKRIIIRAFYFCFYFYFKFESPDLNRYRKMESRGQKYIKYHVRECDVEEHAGANRENPSIETLDVAN